MLFTTMIIHDLQKEEPLTDGQDDEEDQERVHHRHNRQAESRDHLLERPHPPEQSDHAEGPHKAQHRHGDFDGPKRHKRHKNDQGVEHAPRVAEERLRWFGEKGRTGGILLVMQSCRRND
jgi:hypothetical protein